MRASRLLEFTIIGAAIAATTLITRPLRQLDVDNWLPMQAGWSE